ncbi:MAG TPA: hypothetical protein PKD53_03510 [Chloroflexaceae bacterium]|nr:hypothetical protein [Chloroflexaceae bacterium]
MTAERDDGEPRRVSYFNGQFLQEEDFQAEQDYHIAQRRRLTRLTRGAGIVSGLEVEVTSAKDGQLTVAAGLAVDGDGNLLVLPEKRPVTVEYQGLATGFLLIEYGDQRDRLVEVGGGRPTRQVERPIIRFAPADEAPPTGKGVRLARLRLDGKKISALDESGDPLDLSVRRAAGLDLSGDLAVRGAATVGDPGRPQPLAVHGPLSADEAITGASLVAATGGLSVQAGGLTVEQGQATLKGGLSVSGGATVAAGGLTVEKGQAQLKDGLSVSGGATITAGGLTVEKGQTQIKDGLSVQAGGLTVEKGQATLKEGLTVSAGGLTVSGGGLSITAGGLNLSGEGKLSFGSTTRQMLNLWHAAHGIGVQNSTTYFRSSNHFGWYKGGEHSDTSLAAGTGGTALMSLNGDGSLNVAGVLKASGFAMHRLSEFLRVKTTLRSTPSAWQPIEALSLVFNVQYPPQTPLLISYLIIGRKAPDTAFLVTRITVNGNESRPSRCHSQPGHELSNHGLTVAYSSTQQVTVRVEYRSNGQTEIEPTTDWMVGCLTVLVFGNVS